MFPQYRPRSAVWLLATVAIALFVATALSPTSASARTLRFKSVDQSGATFVFKPRGVAPKRVRRAWVSVGGRRIKKVTRRQVKLSFKRRSRLRVRLGVGVARRLGGPLVSRVAAGDRRVRGVLVIRVGGRAARRGAGRCATIVSTSRLGGGRTPGACWRPYSSSSPFNRRLGSDPQVDPRSKQIVRKVMGYGPMEHLRAGQAGKSDDWGHPTYYSRSSDPVYTLHCGEAWGRCSIEGARVRIPAQARAAGGSDGHMTVVDMQSGWEYDMWGVRSKPRGGGTLTTAWGGRTRIDGDGLGSDGVAARYGNLAGKLRAEELAAGEIDHALFIGVKCDSGRHVYPATKSGRSCSDIGIGNGDAPAMGTRFQLDMSDGEIARLRVPQWKKTILRAGAHYGFIVGDTGGTFGLKEEGGLTYTSFGESDKWVELAKKWNVPYYAPDQRYVFNLRDGVDWKNKLRVVEPCESEGRC